MVVTRMEREVSVERIAGGGGYHIGEWSDFTTDLVTGVPSG
jgi:hypothetical protein